MTTSLEISEPINAVELFTQNGIDPILARIRAEVEPLVFDMTTERGRKECASVAHKIARAKTSLDDAGKELVAEWKSKSAVVDKERKRMRDALDFLKEKIRWPLSEWEAKEECRIEAHETILKQITEIDQSAVPLPSAAIRERLAQLGAWYARDWDEYKERADQAYRVSLHNLTVMLSSAEKREAEQAELERLRKSEQERQAKEREERIAREAAERARREEAEKTRMAEEAWLKAEQEKEALQAELARKAEQEAEAVNTFKPLPEIKSGETILFCETLTSEPISKREALEKDLETDIKLEIARYLTRNLGVDILLAERIAHSLFIGEVPYVTLTPTNTLEKDNARDAIRNI